MTSAFKKRFIPGVVTDESIGVSHVRDKFFNISSTESLFAPLPKPSSRDDWLAQYREDGQTFDDWKQHQCRPIIGPIVILPIGSMSDGPDLHILHRYLTVFFTGVDVVLHDVVPIHTARTKRIVRYCEKEFVLQHRRGHAYTMEKYQQDFKQYYTKSFEPISLECLRQNTAFCVLIITMLDLYSSDSDEFSMGVAYLGSARPIGICSFARYTPKFQLYLRLGYRIKQEENENLTTLRVIKTVVHEIMHQFGISHCIFNSCLMQGSGNLEEDFAISHHLCLVDLHKLIYMISTKEHVDMSRRFAEVGGK